MGILPKVYKLLRISIIACVATFSTFAIYANPVLQNVSSGDVSIQQTSSSTVVNQASQKAIINWQSFNIDHGESTHFQQVHGGVALNRISPTQGASQIYGSLTATGQIILVNPAGVYFSPSAYVNVGGLIATTSGISDKNFENGYYYFDQASPFANASIINAGIIAAEHGLVALVGQNVTNTGVIQANAGRIVLGTGSVFTIDLSGDQLINFSTDERAGKIVNSGSLIADGGKILITAQKAATILDDVINLSGVVQAQSVYEQDGEVVISGDPNAGVVNVAANIDAQGLNGLQGGLVNITGYNILLDSPATINVSGDVGGGVINIGGNYQGLGDLPHANAVVMMPGVSLLADAGSQGNGGQIVLWSDNVTRAYGTLSARGGSVSGDGGLIETSSKGYLDVAGIGIDTRAPNGKTGTWLLDPRNVTISTGLTTNPGDFSGANPNIYTPTTDDTNINNDDLSALLGAANVEITTGNTGAQSGDITISDPITWTGSNTLTLTAANDIFIDAGITISDSALASLILNAAGTVTQTAAISGQGSLVQSGAGTTILTEANTYSGGTTINNGILMAGQTNALGTSGAIVVNSGGTLQIAYSGTLANTSGITLSGTGAGGIGALYMNQNNVGTLSNAITLGADTTITNINAGSTLLLNGAITNAGFDTTFDVSGNIIVASLAGAGDVNITGANNLRFSGSNTSYTGTTNLTSGSLILDNTGSLGNALGGPLNITSGASLRLGFVGTMLNINTITVGGTGSGSTPAIESTQIVVLSNPIVMTSNTSFGNFNSFASLTLSGALSGAFNLIFPTAGTLSLTGANAYSGATTVSGTGTLSLGSAGALGSTTGVTVSSGAALNIALNNTTLTNSSTISLSGTGVSSTGALTFSGTNGTINNPLTLTAATTFGGSGSGTLAGLISGTANITKVGSGTQTFSGSNVGFSGKTTISAGAISIAADSGLGVAPGVVTADQLTLAGGTLTTTATFSLATNRGITLGTGGGTINPTSGILTYDGVITGSTALNKTGSGVLLLGGSNTYSGATNINAGTLRLNASGVIADASAVTLANVSGAIFDLNNNNETIGSLAGGGSSGGNVTLGSGTLTMGGDNSSTTMAGAISGSGNIIKTGSGTTTFSQTNSYSGSTSILAGSLSISADANLGAAPGVATPGSLTLNGGTLIGTGSITLNANRGIALGASGGTFNVSSGFIDYSGIVAGAGSLTKTGTASLILAGANSYSGATLVSAGSLGIDSAGALGNTTGTTINSGASLLIGASQTNTADITVNGLGVSGGGALQGTGTATLNNNIILATDSNITSSSTGNVTYNGVISGSGNLTIGFTGSPFTSPITFTQNNTYTGTTTIASNVLNIGNGGTSGSLGSGAVINNAELSFNRSNSLTVANDISGTGTLSQIGTGTTVLTSNNNTYSGATNITNGILQIGDNVTGSLGTGTVTITNPGTLFFTVGATVANTIQGTGNFEINTVSPVTLTANNSYSGTTTIDAGQLVIGANSTSGTLGSGNVINNGLLEFFRSNSYTVNNAISGNGDVSQSGSGLIILTGNNTYSGSTSVSNMQVGNGGTVGSLGTGSIFTTGGILAIDRSDGYTLANTLLGTGTVDQNASGLLTISGNSPLFLGAINGNSGDITVTSTNGLGAATVTINNGNNLNLNSAPAGAATIVINSSTLNINGVSAGDVVVTLDNSTLNTTGTASLGTAPGSNSLTIGNSSTINVASGSFTVNSLIEGATASADTLTLQGAGGVTLMSDIGSTISLGTFTSNANVTVGNNFAITADTIQINNAMSGAAFTLGLNGSAINIQNVLTLANLNIAGTGASNTLTVNTGNSQTWTLNAADTGTLATTGLGAGSFSSIQNLIGGDNVDNFVFANDTATFNFIDGGSLSNSAMHNTLNYQATSPVTITLAANKFNGSATNITSYNNIDNLIGQTNNHSTLVPANQAQINDTVISDAATGTGYMGDPLTWTGFDAPSNPSPTPGTIDINVSQIIVQPENNNNSSSGSFSYSAYEVGQNIDTLLAQAQALFDTDLNRIKINPYCGTSGPF